MKLFLNTLFKTYLMNLVGLDGPCIKIVSKNQKLKYNYENECKHELKIAEKNQKM